MYDIVVCPLVGVGLETIKLLNSRWVVHTGCFYLEEDLPWIRETTYNTRWWLEGYVSCCKNYRVEQIFCFRSLNYSTLICLTSRRRQRLDCVLSWAHFICRVLMEALIFGSNILGRLAAVSLLRLFCLIVNLWRTWRNLCHIDRSRINFVIHLDRRSTTIRRFTDIIRGRFYYGTPAKIRLPRCATGLSLRCPRPLSNPYRWYSTDVSTISSMSNRTR